ncbi:RHS repeat-associated core domain-containing protein [Chitinophaga costaii]|uniref:RHS repeat-associated core domain-containing protein n=1 Tax=Chitinophaga costaii TaxID=1335309 RepID=UPI0013FD1ECE|nr:RHS repeat-associated core domain-containing protein [Chitinophaga costaii]
MANRLRHILDGVSGSNYANKDLVNQAADNYHYDNIGNLTADPANGVSQIQWTVYGKISRITKTNGDALKYTYDATGNRIYKEYISGGVTSRTWYARDAQGNTLAVYGNKNGDSQVYWNEQDLYGSSRLGTWQPGITLTAGAGATAWSQEGLSRYELTNHLGNVLSTISDQRVGVDNDHNGTIDYYLPTIASYSDYTPFGMQMVDRNGSAGGYRYGFNGKENDNEVKGEGNQQDYGMRVYDPRVGRFLSVDPLTREYPWNSSYAFAENQPIWAIDLDGLEKITIHQRTFAPWDYFGNIFPDQKPYKGDNRGFNMYYKQGNKWITSRIVSVTKLDVATAKQIGETVVYSDPSIGPRNFYGEVGSSTETPDQRTEIEKQFTVENGKSIRYGSKISINIQGHDARVEDFMAPDIDWTGKLDFDNREPGILSMHGGLDGKGFPAYEQFIEDSKGQRIMTYTHMAPPKKQIFTLFGGTITQGSNWLKIGVDQNGNFTGKLKAYEAVPHTGSFWSGLFKKTKYQWNEYTVDQWNEKQLSKPAAKDRQ